MAYTQTTRLCSVDTPLGPDALLLQGLDGQEGISTPFEFALDLLSEDPGITAEAVLGQATCARIELADGSDRFFHGLVAEFEQGGCDARFTSYRLVLRPWLWCLTLRTDCRIFQEKDVPTIVEEVFTKAGFTDFELRLSGAYKPRVFCVQYRESDFDFVSRLLEEEGIFYFFEHSRSEHRLILADAPSAIKPCPNEPDAGFRGSDGGTHQRDEITVWRHRRELHTGKCSLKDYFFEDPSNPLDAKAPTAAAIGNNSRFEAYDHHPGEYESSGDGDAIAKVRMTEQETAGVRVLGRGSCRDFVSGHRFTLKEHFRPDMTDRPYVITTVRHRLRQPSPLDSDDGAQTTYENDFTCFPANQRYCPPRITPRPRVEGPQTAVVVGPGGEEIYVDEYGRIKVQFHWDREGKKDQNSSCWVRVSQMWAGKKWGALAHPRIDDEVIVEFLEGDPDKPIITGCVYNKQRMPPYSLPANKTQTGIKTRSSKDGSPSNFNELRFEDKIGEEELYIQAEKDKNVLVKNDRSEKVGHDETIEIGNDRTETVGNDETIKIGHDRREEVANNEAIKIGHDRCREVVNNEAIKIGNDRFETVGNNETIEIANNREHKIGCDDSLEVGGSQSLEVSSDREITVGTSSSLAAGTTVSVVAGTTIKIQAGTKIELVVGGSSVTIDASGVTVAGPIIKLN